MSRRHESFPQCEIEDEDGYNCLDYASDTRCPSCNLYEAMKAYSCRYWEYPPSEMSGAEVWAELES